MTEVVSFKTEHIQMLDPVTLNKLGMVQGWVEKAEIFSKVGKCFSAFVNGELIACAGVNVLWPGTGEAWAIVTPRIYKNKLFFHKAVKNNLEDIIKTKCLKRVQAQILVGFTAGARWIESLGFELEGVLKKYDSMQNDYWMFARVED